MRISDWSSDVCSSDLRDQLGEAVLLAADAVGQPLEGDGDRPQIVATRCAIRRGGLDLREVLQDGLARLLVEGFGERLHLATDEARLSPPPPLALTRQTLEFECLGAEEFDGVADPADQIGRAHV